MFGYLCHLPFFSIFFLMSKEITTTIHLDLIIFIDIIISEEWNGKKLLSIQTGEKSIANFVMDIFPYFFFHIVQIQCLPVREPFRPSHFRLATPNQLDATWLEDCRQSILTSFAYRIFCIADRDNIKEKEQKENIASFIINYYSIYNRSIYQKPKLYKFENILVISFSFKFNLTNDSSLKCLTKYERIKRKRIRVKKMRT